jgi:hypothetical protein
MISGRDGTTISGVALRGRAAARSSREVQVSSSFVEIRSWHRPMMIMVAAMAGLVVVAGVGLAVDDRQLLDGSVWAKPFKFAVSFVIYGATLAWMLSKLRRARRTMWALGTIFAVTGLVDVGFVAVQAARGTYSHFNSNTDAFNAIGQEVFQYGVMALFAANLLIAVILLFDHVGDAALTWALRAGIVLAVLGMGVAFFIAGSSTDGKRTVEDAYGNPVRLGGAHGVGVPDGAGMPITNWSVEGGDLRVPHFIGLHAVQVFVLAALVLAALTSRVVWLRGERVRAQLTGVVILGYSGLFVVTTWQAMRGQSLVHPDAATWTALVATLGATALLTTVIVATARRGTPSRSTHPVPVDAPRRRGARAETGSVGRHRVCG